MGDSITRISDGNAHIELDSPLTEAAEAKSLDTSIKNFSKDQQKLASLLFEVKGDSYDTKVVQFLTQIKTPFDFDSFRTAYKSVFGIDVTEAGYKAFFNCQTLSHAPAEIEKMMTFAEKNSDALIKLNYPGGKQQIANDFFQSTKYFDIEQSAIKAAETELNRIIADKKTEETFTGLTVKEIKQLDGDEKTVSKKDIGMALLQFFRNYGDQIDINKPDLTITKAETEAFIKSGMNVAKKSEAAPQAAVARAIVPVGLSLPVALKAYDVTRPLSESDLQKLDDAQIKDFYNHLWKYQTDKKAVQSQSPTRADVVKLFNEIATNARISTQFGKKGESDKNVVAYAKEAESKYEYDKAAKQTRLYRLPAKKDKKPAKPDAKTAEQLTSYNRFWVLAQVNAGSKTSKKDKYDEKGNKVGDEYIRKMEQHAPQQMFLYTPSQEIDRDYRKLLHDLN